MEGIDTIKQQIWICIRNTSVSVVFWYPCLLIKLSPILKEICQGFTFDHALVVANVVQSLKCLWNKCNYVFWGRTCVESECEIMNAILTTFPHRGDINCQLF